MANRISNDLHAALPLGRARLEREMMKYTMKELGSYLESQSVAIPDGRKNLLIQTVVETVLPKTPVSSPKRAVSPVRAVSRSPVRPKVQPRVSTPQNEDALLASPSPVAPKSPAVSDGHPTQEKNSTLVQILLLALFILAAYLITLANTVQQHSESPSSAPVPPPESIPVDQAPL